MQKANTHKQVVTELSKPLETFLKYILEFKSYNGVVSFCFIYNVKQIYKTAAKLAPAGYFRYEAKRKVGAAP